jgi:hypothetical protein
VSATTPVSSVSLADEQLESPTATGSQNKISSAFMAILSFPYWFYHDCDPEQIGLVFQA